MKTFKELITESNKFSSHGFTFTISGSQDREGSYIIFLPDSKTVDTYSKDEMAGWIDTVFNNMEFFRDCMAWEKNHNAAGIVFRINANYLADSLLNEFKS